MEKSRSSKVERIRPHKYRVGAALGGAAICLTSLTGCWGQQAAKPIVTGVEHAAGSSAGKEAAERVLQSADELAEQARPKQPGEIKPVRPSNPERPVLRKKEGKTESEVDVTVEGMYYQITNQHVTDAFDDDGTVTLDEIYRFDCYAADLTVATGEVPDGHISTSYIETDANGTFQPEVVEYTPLPVEGAEDSPCTFVAQQIAAVS